MQTLEPTIYAVYTKLRRGRFQNRAESQSQKTSCSATPEPVLISAEDDFSWTRHK